MAAYAQMNGLFHKLAWDYILRKIIDRAFIEHNIKQIITTIRKNFGAKLLPIYNPLHYNV